MLYYIMLCLSAYCIIIIFIVSLDSFLRKASAQPKAMAAASVRSHLDQTRAGKVEVGCKGES